MLHSRRDFLKSTLGSSALLSLSPTVPMFLSRSANAASSKTGETVLVVIQLSGGNDGLNTVVPYGNDEYARSRPTLRLASGDVHKIDDELGFHPRMPGFARLYQEGFLSVVQGVGYPNMDRDHAAAMRNWNTAEPTKANCQTGWLGRTIDRAIPSDASDTPAVFVGSTSQPLGLNAETGIVPSIQSLEDYTLQSMPGPNAAQTQKNLQAEIAGLRREDDGNSLMRLVQTSTTDMYATNRRVEAVAQSGAPASSYPRFRLARMLGTVAQLIRADVGIRIYFTQLGGDGFGGFDNHANQRGNHGALLHQLSESVAAFVDDLERDKLLDRVLLMTFSEFGRTVKENGRRGTGHGAAAPMFLAGGKLKGGLIGPHPSLTDPDGDALEFHTDFRQVYATALDRWLGLDSRAALNETFEPVDVL